MFCSSKGGGGGGGWGDFHIKRTPKRFQDLVLWAWLEMFFFAPNWRSKCISTLCYVMLCYAADMESTCMYVFFFK